MGDDNKKSPSLSLPDHSVSSVDQAHENDSGKSLAKGEAANPPPNGKEHQQQQQQQQQQLTSTDKEGGMEEDDNKEPFAPSSIKEGQRSLLSQQEEDTRGTFPFPQPMPLPLQVHVHSEDRQPGAYSCEGRSSIHNPPARLPPSSASSVVGGAWLPFLTPSRVAREAESLSSIQNDNEDMDMERNNPTNNNANANLVQARAIPDGEEVTTIAIAEQTFPVNASQKRSRNRAGISPTKAALLLVFAVAILVVTGVVVLVLWLSGTLDLDNNDTAVITSTTQNNSTLSLVAYLKQRLPNKTLSAIFTEENSHDDDNVNDNEHLTGPLLTSSPQSSAFQWLSQDALLRNYTDTRIRQRFAMASLFYATNGPTWEKSDNWLSYDHHECHWFVGHTFNILGQVQTAESACREMPEEARDIGNSSSNSNSTSIDTHTLQEGDDPNNQFIRRLWFRQNNLNGTIPDEMYWLTHLEEIDMSTNNIRGQLSSTGLVQLSHLKALSFPHNSLSGQVPTELGMMTQLTNIYFGNAGAAMKGSIPSELGRLTNLKFLTMSRTGFTGTLATELGALTDLMVMAIQGTDVTGTIPSELGRLTNLMYSAFFSNHFSGTLPTEFFLLTKLAWLGLQNNQLSGPLPNRLSQMVSLQELKLYNNFFSSTIPTEIGLLPRVYLVDLSNNQISGLLPSEMGLMKNIQTWNIAANNLSGSIPKEVSLWSDIALFNMSGNEGLSGTVPERLCATLNASFLAFDCDNSTNAICGCMQCPCT